VTRLQEEMSSDEFVRWKVFIQHETDAGDRVDVLCAKVIATLAGFGGTRVRPEEAYSDPWDPTRRPGYAPKPLRSHKVLEVLKAIKGLTVRTPDGKVERT
jgi:hypothetical protein